MTDTPLTKQIDGVLFATQDAGPGNAEAYQQNQNLIGWLLNRTVLTVGQNNPPAGVDGDRHLIGPEPGEEWTLHPNELARKNSAAPEGWDFLKPPELLDVYCVADGMTYVFSAGVPLPPISELTGIIKPYGGAAAPAGYLMCDGAEYGRGVYPALFAVIGTFYGSTSGHVFNVPDLRGRAPFGVGTNPDIDSRGANEGLVVADRDPWHLHEADGTVTAAAGVDVTANSGPTAFQAVPYLGVNYIIKT